MMEHWAEARPQEMRQSPDSCTNVQAPTGMTWISTLSSLSGNKGDYRQPEGWLRWGCHYRALSYLFGYGSPELQGFHNKLESNPNLLEELERRAGLDMAG